MDVHTHQMLPVLLVLLCATVVCRAQAPADFTPPGPNVALHKPYTLEPAPNYGDCSTDPDRTLLTDGAYTQGHFWVQKTTVGWVHRHPVAITIDLGGVEAISGVSYSTAAGSADVAWPSGILLMVSDDNSRWTVLGDLIVLANKQGAPPEQPYRTHRFVTGELQAHGRYLALVVDQPPYMVVDEVEVYGGKPEWLTQPMTGKQVDMKPLEYCRDMTMQDSINARLRTDLDEIVDRAEGAGLSDAAGAQLRDRAEALRAEIQPIASVPDDLTTILPLNDLHTRIYALHAPVLRAQGYTPLAIWKSHRYDPLQPLDVPRQLPTSPPALRTSMMRNERRAETLNLTNSTDGPLAAELHVTGLGARSGLVALREVVFTDTLQRTPIAAAILPPESGGDRLRLTIPAGMTRQVWVDLDSRETPAGTYQAALAVEARAAEAVTVPLTVRVSELVMPDEFDIAIGGWDETNNKGGYEVTAENMMPLIANLREHGVNMPWSNPQVMPTPGEYDAEGNMTAPPDFTSWDEWVARWEGARCWGLFPNVGDNFAGEPVGTPRFNKMVGAWVTAWVEHAAGQGIEPGQIMVLLVDETRTDAQDQRVIDWAKALHAAQPDVVIWNDPIHTEPQTVAPEFYEQSDVLCPNTIRFLELGKPYQDFFVARQQEGSELWFYCCSGPTKLLDPASYYRAQFWLNLKYDGGGSLYWAFGDEAGGSWNAYMQTRNQYSPLFLSPTTVTDGKHMEAIREGAQDYEYFRLLRERVVELEAAGVKSELLAEANALLVSGPERVVRTMGREKMVWALNKDRQIMDVTRLRALDMLEKLSEL